MGDEDADEPKLPGKDPDPGARIQKRIMVGWALIGLFFSAGILSVVLTHLGIKILPEQPTMIDYVRIIAFAVACINIGSWMWFPLQDLLILRQWVRTRRKIFPYHTSEFLSIVLATMLLLLLILGSLCGPFWFGVTGACAFLWNLLGFAFIRKHVADAVSETRFIYGRQSKIKQKILLRALEIVEWHWSLQNKGLFGGWQQNRHLLLSASFVVVALIAVFDSDKHFGVIAEITAYSVGIFALLFGHIWISIRRVKRDRRLMCVEEELRGLEA